MSVIENILNICDTTISKNFNGKGGLPPSEKKELRSRIKETLDNFLHNNEQTVNNKNKVQYKAIVEALNEGVLIVDNDDKIQYVNDKLCEMTGYTKTELLGKTAREIFLQKKEQEYIKQIIKDRKEGMSSQYELPIMTKDGIQKIMLINGAPLLNKTGEIIGSLGAMTDISLSRKYEKELDFVARIPEENPNPILRYSILKEDITYSNRAGKGLLAFLNKNEDIKREWFFHIESAWKRNQTLRKELSFGEKTFMCTFTPVLNYKYVNLYASDITVIRKAEEEIRMLSFAIGKTDNAVIIADKNGKIEWVNDGFKQFTGYSLSDVKGTHGETLRKGEKTGLDSTGKHFKKVKEQRKTTSYESLNYRKDGTEYWTLSTLTPVFNNDGTIDRIIAVDTDITDKKRYEQELTKAKKKAEQSAAAKQMFLANMSHEIRTPMNAIMGFMQLLKESELTEEQQEYLYSMDFAGENLLRIINDVLDLSKIESGKMSIEKTEFDLIKLIDDLVESLKYRAKEKGLKVKINKSKNLPKVVVGDPVRLNQILTNLISNGIKFTEKGEVILSISCQSNSKTKSLLQFSVKDTGVGIPKDLQNHIFTAFNQAKMSTTRKYGGTGLGLSITKRLVELQKGTISLKSELKVGSEFIVELNYAKPYKVNFNKTVSEKDLHALLEMAGKEILLVEDNSLNQMVAKKFLTSFDLNVTIANNGLEAVNKLKSFNYDLILMDIQMPEMDGYTTCSYIRNKFKNTKSNIPIIAMTAHAIDGEKKKCLNAGMDDYLTKPIKKDVLQQKIAKYLA